jgi:hypothetical protein
VPEDKFQFRKFRFEDYDPVNTKIESGEQKINNHAVGIILEVFLKITG